MSKQKKQQTLEELLAEALVPAEEQPYQVPDNWVWVRLGNIANVKRGASPRPKGDPKYFGGTIPWLKISDVTKQGKHIYFTHDTVTEAGKEKSVWVKPDTLILSISASVGRPCINKVGVCIHDGFVKIDENEKIVIKDFLYYYLVNALNQIVSKAKGATQININSNIVKQIPIIIPPLNEQTRIVNKLENLLGKIDEAKQLIQEVQDSFELRRMAILDQAFRGELVEESMCNISNTGIELIGEIKKRKTDLILKKKLKKTALIDDENITPLFSLPSKWTWVSLANVAHPSINAFVDGPFGSNLKKEEYQEEGVRLIQLQNIKKGFWNDTNKKYVTEEKANSLERCIAYPGDIAVAKMAHPVARATIIPEIDEKYVIVADCVKITVDKSVDAEYISWLLNSPFMRKQAESVSSGSTRKRISLGNLKKMSIPLPPFEVQQKIVSEIILLFNKLDKEEVLVRQAEKQLNTLKQSILSKAFCGELGTTIQPKNRRLSF